mgnify:CR=1 FL=1
MSNLVGIPWPASLSYPMQVISGLWSTAQGTSIGLECVLPHESKIPLGVQKVLLCLLTPAAILCVIVVFEAIWQKVRPRRYVRVGNQTQLLNGRVGCITSERLHLHAIQCVLGGDRDGCCHAVWLLCCTALPALMYDCNDAVPSAAI